VPASSDGLPLPVGVSLAGMDDGLNPEVKPKSAGSHDGSSLDSTPSLHALDDTLDGHPAVVQDTTVFKSPRRGRRKLGICFKCSTYSFGGESSGRIVVIGVTPDGYMWNLGFRVFDEVILDIIKGPLRIVQLTEVTHMRSLSPCTCESRSSLMLTTSNLQKTQKRPSSGHRQLGSF